MMEPIVEDPVIKKKNLKSGLLLGLFAILTTLLAMINFFHDGLPKDANRMRERDQKRTAAEAQNLSEALQNAEAIQQSKKSEEVE